MREVELEVALAAAKAEATSMTEEVVEKFRLSPKYREDLNVEVIII